MHGSIAIDSFKVETKHNKLAIAIIKWLQIRPSFLKTIRFNFKYFSFEKALKIPVWVSKRVLLYNCKGTVDIESELEPGMIELGFGNVPLFDKYRNRTVWNNNGKVIFKGSCLFKHGSKIGVGGKLTIGDNFHMAPESIIICEKEIEIGDNVSVSWRSQLMDTDYHHIFENGVKTNQDKKIKIGNNVWIGNNVLIQKGTILLDNTIAAAGSVVTRVFKKGNIIVAGIPAKKIIEGVSWSR